MEESEFALSAGGEAWNSFDHYIQRVLILLFTFKANTDAVQGLRALAPQDVSDHSENAESLKGPDEALQYSMCIVAAWGAFEAYVEDVCKGAMALDPSILDNKQIKNLSIKVSDFFASASVKLDIVFRAIKASIDTRDISERYRRILTYVDLDVELSDPYDQRFIDSYKVRNVWAHSAGRADAKFVKEAASLGFEIGDEVQLTAEGTVDYIASLYVYAALTYNRLRTKVGLPGIRMESDEFIERLKPKTVSTVVEVMNLIRSFGKDSTINDEGSEPDTSLTASDDLPESQAPLSEEAPPVQTTSPDSAAAPEL
ncbi:hypothetical protein [Mycolicibacterium sp. PDY-3]|uniref:hypothetical protein n=1 Tax=Mycolicibacterium sp. PDY-3 TaxID=3376069 RepID=UPI0037BDB6BA